MTIATASVIDRHRERILREWTDPDLIAAYRRWGDHEAAWGSAARDLIVERARLQPGLHVLDVASGHGEPALAIAERVGPRGRVTATDQSVGLLEIARERAARAGLDNVSFHRADAHHLPFLDATFDRVTCRLGAMFFADPVTAFREARRVLRPGGRATYLVWGPRDQPLFDLCVGLLFGYVQEPSQDEADGPGVFAFARTGSISEVLADAGFTEVEEDQVRLPAPFPGTPADLWQWFADMAPPFKPIIGSLPPETLQRFLDDLYGRLEAYHDGTTVDIPIDVIIASATT